MHPIFALGGGFLLALSVTGVAVHSGAPLWVAVPMALVAGIYSGFAVLFCLPAGSPLAATVFLAAYAALLPVAAVVLLKYGDDPFAAPPGPTRPVY